MGVVYNSRTVTDGLILCLDAVNPRSYPGSGTTWYDLSGNGNHGTLTNGPTFSSKGISFDGVNDYVNIGNLGQRSSTGSISFWMWLSSWGSYPNAFGTNPNVDGQGNRGIRFELNGSGAFVVAIGNDSALNNSTLGGGYYFNNSIPINKWHHILLSWNDVSNVAIGYANGSQVFNNTCTTWPTNFANVVIGRGWFERYWNGKLNDIRIYNRALSVDEITQNYNATKGRYL